MKKNFLRLGALLSLATALLVGVTSCVSDDVATEVQDIYTKQASWIGAQTELTLAQAEYQKALTQTELQNAALMKAKAEKEQALADYEKAILSAKSEAAVKQFEAAAKNAEAAYKAAEAALLANKQALEIAQLEYEYKIFEAKVKNEKEMTDKQWEHVSQFFTPYEAAVGELIAAEADLVDFKNAHLLAKFALEKFKKYPEDYYDINGKVTMKGLEEQVKDKEAAYAGAKAAYDAQLEKLAALKARLSDENALEGKLKQLQDRQKAVDAEIAKNNAEKARVQGVIDTEYDIFTDVAAARGEVKTVAGALAAHKKDLVDQKKAYDDNKKKLKDAGHEDASSAELQALIDKATNDEKPEKQNALDKATDELNDVQDDYDNLDVKYNTAVHDYAVKQGQVDGNSTAIAAATTAKDDAKAELDAAQANYDADPDGQTITGDGGDNAVGNHSDSKTGTYMLFNRNGSLEWVPATGVDPIYIATGATIADLKTEWDANHAVGDKWADHSNFVASSIKAFAALAAGDENKVWVEVEANDTYTNNADQLAAKEVVYNAALDDYNNLTKTSGDLAGELAELKAEYLRLHNLLVKQNEDLDKAKQAKKDAQDALDAVDDKITALTGLKTTAEAIETYVAGYMLPEKVAKNKAKTVDLEEQLVVATKKYEDLAAKVSDQGLEEYRKLLKEQDGYELANIKLNAEKDQNTYMITYFGKMIEIEDAYEHGTYAAGTSIKDFIKAEIDALKAKASFVNAKNNFGAAKAALDTAKRNLAAAQKDETVLGELPNYTTALANLEKDLAKAAANVKKQEVKVEELKAKVAKYKAAYEKALADLEK